MSAERLILLQDCGKSMTFWELCPTHCLRIEKIGFISKESSFRQFPTAKRITESESYRGNDARPANLWIQKSN
jgi:hypothetical protein